MRETISCKQCGVNTTNAKFCSVSCSVSFSWPSRRKRFQKELAARKHPCEACGKPTLNPKFCGHSCSAKVTNKERAGDLPICRRCEKEITRRRGPKRIYCSHQCSSEYRTIQIFESGKGSSVNAKTYLQKILGCVSCMICNTYSWCDKPLILELDHINGDPNNHSLRNIRLLCPNCHSQTPTYKAKNKGNGRHIRRERYAQGKSY